MFAALALVAAGAGASGADSAPRLVMARVKDALDLDPAHAVESRSFNITNEVLQNLVAFKPGSFEIVGDAARSWSVSPDGKTWTFELVPGLAFSDGTPLDAAAVKFNFDRWRLPAHPAHGRFLYTYYSSDFGGFPGLIADVRAPSPTRVVIALTKPLGPFLRDIAEPSFAIGSPQAISADPVRFEREPVGSGPYTVAEWVKNDHITLRANPRYAGPKPGYGTVVVRAVPDPAAGVRLLRDGAIDMLTDAPPAAVAALRAQPGIAVAEQPSNNVSYLDLNVQRKPFGDVQRRIEAILRNKLRRLDAVRQAVESGPATVVEIADRVFSRVMLQHQRSFALAETLAHIAYLRHDGVVERRVRPDGIYEWYATGKAIP